MGTSVSHRSPESLQWETAQRFYKDKRVPLFRVLSEIWRACDALESSSLRSLENKEFLECAHVIERHESLDKAVESVRQILRTARANGVVSELAVRAVPKTFHSQDRTSAWLPEVLASVTDYLVSRDISGFVGEKYRNLTIREVQDFRRKLVDQARNVLSTHVDFERRGTAGSWKAAVKRSISALKESKE